MSSPDHEWADLHGYSGYTCPICGWSGVTDSPACEICPAEDPLVDEDEDAISDAYEIGLEGGDPVSGWSSAQWQAYRSGLREGRSERAEEDKSR